MDRHATDDYGRAIMPKVTVKGDSPHNASETFEKITRWLDHDKDLRKLDADYQCRFDAASMTGTATGSQFKADLAVKAQGPGAVVEIVVDLPFHLTLVKGMVEKTLKRKLEESLS